MSATARQRKKDLGPGPEPSEHQVQNTHLETRVLRLNRVAGTNKPGSNAPAVRKFVDYAPWKSHSPNNTDSPPDTHAPTAKGPARTPHELSELVSNHLHQAASRSATPSTETERTDLAAAQRRAYLQAEHQHVATVARFVSQSAFEILAGVRPLVQLSKWMDPAAYGRLHLRLNVAHGRTINPRIPTGVPTSAPHRNNAKRGPDAPRSMAQHHPTQTPVQRLRLCRISDGIYEASAVVNYAGRLRAVALRLELQRDQWRVTALQLG